MLGRAEFILQTLHKFRETGEETVSDLLDVKCLMVLDDRLVFGREPFRFDLQRSLSQASWWRHYSLLGILTNLVLLYE